MEHSKKHPPDAATNLLSYNRPFDSIGSTAAVSSEPAEVHFRGFVPGQRVSQVVQLRNNSHKQTRVVVIQPVSSSFQVVEDSPGGSLAPGLCRRLVVEFCGERLQPYQDRILVHTEDGGLSVPLLAYPCTGSPRLPKQLDLGNVPMGETLSHKLQLNSTAGMAFDFSVTVLQHNPHFAVAPLSGTIPAGGCAAVTVTFTPTKYSTEHMQLQVQLSECESQPMRVLITGSSRPGLVQQQILTKNMDNYQLAQTNFHQQAAIAARKLDQAAEHQRLQSALADGIKSGMDPLDDPDIQPDIKEALFQMQLSSAQAGARHCTGLMADDADARLGSVPPTDAELAGMAAARAAAWRQAEEQRHSQARHRLQLELKAAGAVHALTQPTDTSSSSGQQSSTAGPYPGLDSFQPQWLLLSESNGWRKRVQVVQRFVHAVRVVIYRNRAQARLKKLRGLAAKLVGSKDGLAGSVLQDVLLEGSVTGRPGLPPAQLMQPDKVRLTDLPMYCPLAYVQHQHADAGLYADFSALQPQPYQAEFEYKLLGYAAEDFPSLLLYVPLCSDQPLLSGAAEDELGGMECGVLADPCLSGGLSGMDTLPDGLLSSPQPCNTGNRELQFKATQLWGHPEHMLPPSSYQFKDSTAELSGLNSAKALACQAIRSVAPSATG